MKSKLLFLALILIFATQANAAPIPLENINKPNVHERHPEACPPPHDPYGGCS